MRASGKDAIQWPALKLDLDQGPDGFALANYLEYEKKLNLDRRHDYAHGVHNDVKQNLKDNRLL